MFGGAPGPVGPDGVPYWGGGPYPGAMGPGGGCQDGVGAGPLPAGVAPWPGYGGGAAYGPGCCGLSGEGLPAAAPRLAGDAVCGDGAALGQLGGGGACGGVGPGR